AGARSSEVRHGARASSGPRAAGLRAGGAPPVSPVRRGPDVPRLVPDGARLLGLWSPLRAGAGLLRRRDLPQLRGDNVPRDRRLRPALGVHGAHDRGAARPVAPRGRRVSPVVLPLQPELLARPRVRRQPRVLALVLLAAQALGAPGVGAAYEVVGVADGGAVTGTLKFMGTPTVFNVALPNKDQLIDVTRRLAKPGVVHVLCDAHTHMAAWILVHDSPYVAVTDERGVFRIADVPPGTYKVTMWHEGFRGRGVDKDGRPVYDEPQTVTREVTIAPRAVATVDFELR